MQMQTETFIIMIVGLLAIGLIRLVIAIGGREYAADHPHVKSKAAQTSAQTGAQTSAQTSPEGDATSAGGAALAVPSRRPVRGTGRRSHLLYFPDAAQADSAGDAPPAADSEPVLPSAS